MNKIYLKKSPTGYTLRRERKRTKHFDFNQNVDFKSIQKYIKNINANLKYLKLELEKIK